MPKKGSLMNVAENAQEACSVILTVHTEAVGCVSSIK